VGGVGGEEVREGGEGRVNFVGDDFKGGGCGRGGRVGELKENFYGECGRFNVLSSSSGTAGASVGDEVGKSPMKLGVDVFL